HRRAIERVHRLRGSDKKVAADVLAELAVALPLRLVEQLVQGRFVREVWVEGRVGPNIGRLGPGKGGLEVEQPGVPPPEPGVFGHSCWGRWIAHDEECGVRLRAAAGGYYVHQRANVGGYLRRHPEPFQDRRVRGDGLNLRPEVHACQPNQEGQVRAGLVPSRVTGDDERHSAAEQLVRPGDFEVAAVGQIPIAI